MLAKVKKHLCQLALSQLNEEKIDEYLIKSQVKDKTNYRKYILQFRQELESGKIRGKTKKQYNNS